MMANGKEAELPKTSGTPIRSDDKLASATQKDGGRR
jgi:hypothetical protein